MDFVAVEDERCVLRDVHPVVYKVFGGIVRRRYPKRRVGALYLKKQARLRSETGNGRVSYLLDDGLDIRKALLVLCTRPGISANHAVKLRMSSGLNFWV
jgi:hypothetical protein